MAQSKTAAKRAQGQATRQKCLEFRKLGLTFEAIGNKLGCSAVNVHKHVKKALEELAEQNKDMAEDYRQLQLIRLEGLYLSLQAKAGKGDVAAIGQAVRVLDSISKLVGADAPTKVAPTTPDGKQPYSALHDLTDAERKARILELQKKLDK